jgi:inorganic triphosphatase YgiF
VTKTDQVERELKLGAWPEFALPDLDGFVDGAKAGESVRHDLDASYYDTPDLKLLRRGVTLRFRRGEPPGDVWTAKLPSNAPVHGLARREITVPGRRDVVPKQFVDLTRGWMLGRGLRPIARVSTVRDAIPLCDGQGRVLATMDDDTVTVRRGRRVVARFRELEVELVGDAPAEVLTAVDESLRAAGAEHVAQIPKLTRALGREAALPWDLEVLALRSKPTMAQAAQASFRAGVAQLVDLHALLVLDADGSATRAREVVRALEAELDVFASLLEPARVPSIQEELSRLDSAFARVAELDKLLAQAGERREARALEARLIDARTRAHAALMRALRERRYTTLLERLAGIATDPPPNSGAAGRRVAASAAKFVRPRWRALRQEVAALGEPSDVAAMAKLAPEVARLEAALELPASGPVDDAQPALERVRELRWLLADRDEALALVRRLHALRRRLDTDETWAAGLLAGIATVQAEASGARFAGAWEAAADKALWSWVD